MLSGYGSVVRIELGQREAPNLKALLEASSVQKIFHFARFDVATLRHHLDIVVTPVFCTKVASKLARRTYSPKHGLKELVRDGNVDLFKNKKIGQVEASIVEN
jgi:ribonuclease D